MNHFYLFVLYLHFDSGRIDLHNFFNNFNLFVCDYHINFFLDHFLNNFDNWSLHHHFFFLDLDSWDIDGNGSWLDLLCCNWHVNFPVDNLDDSFDDFDGDFFDDLLDDFDMLLNNLLHILVMNYFVNNWNQFDHFFYLNHFLLDNNFFVNELGHFLDDLNLDFFLNFFDFSNMLLHNDSSFSWDVNNLDLNLSEWYINNFVNILDHRMDNWNFNNFLNFFYCDIFNFHSFHLFNNVNNWL